MESLVTVQLGKSRHERRIVSDGVFVDLSSAVQHWFLMVDSEKISHVPDYVYILESNVTYICMPN